MKWRWNGVDISSHSNVTAILENPRWRTVAILNFETLRFHPSYSEFYSEYDAVDGANISSGSKVMIILKIQDGGWLPS